MNNRRILVSSNWFLADSAPQIMNIMNSFQKNLFLREVLRTIGLNRKKFFKFLKAFVDSIASIPLAVLALVRRSLSARSVYMCQLINSKKNRNEQIK